MDISPEVVAHAKLAIASFGGGAIRLFLRPMDGETAWERLFKSAWCLVGCVTCGFYLTPVMMDWAEFPPAWEGAVGAVLGLIGLSLAEGTLKAVDGFELRAWVAKLIERKTGA